MHLLFFSTTTVQIYDYYDYYVLYRVSHKSFELKKTYKKYVQYEIFINIKGYYFYKNHLNVLHFIPGTL